jgi:hypothetical protein
MQRKKLLADSSCGLVFIFGSRSFFDDLIAGAIAEDR